LKNKLAAYTKLGELRLAVKDCDEAIKLDSKFIKAYLRKGHAQFVMKEYSNALETYDQASKIDPTNDEARDGIAKTIAAVQGSQGGESEEEILKRASQDPEIREILSDPVMKQILQDMQTDPKAAAQFV
jgi:stress-induced-phosphoprotein 1